MSRKNRNDPQRAAQPATLPETMPWWRQRRGVLGAAIGLLIVLLLILASQSWAILLLQLPTDALLLTLWLLAAAGYGATFLTVVLKEANTILRAVTCVALGLGIISLLQLALGLADLIYPIAGYAMLLLGITLLAFRCRSLCAADLKLWFAAPATVEWLWLCVIPIFAMVIIAAYVPPGILWGDEPHGYDVLEYHLQLPREWFELHRITPLYHNVFSYFPLATEMHYLLAMQLRFSPWGGMYLAQLMHVAMFALTIVSIYAAARLITSKPAAIGVSVAAASQPWMLLLAPVAYNEGGLLLFGTLSLAWVIKPLGNRETLTRPWTITGLLAGFACGVKLTAVPQLLVIVPVIAAIIAIAARLEPKRIASAFVVSVFAGIVAFSPWLLRNAFWTGNPVFPEGQSLFGRAHFSEIQSRRWHRAHNPPPNQQSIAARLKAAKDQILRDARFGWLFLPAGLVATIAAFRRPEAKLLLVLLLAWLGFWLAFTHLQSRFYVLAIPAAAIALALLDRRALAVVAVVQVVIGIGISAAAFEKHVLPAAEKGVLAFDDFSKFLSDDVQLMMAANRPISLIGDARALLYPVPMSRLHYRTVFDVDIQPGQSVIDAWAAGEPPGAARIIDQAELDRFANTYFGIPVSPAPATTRPVGN